MVMPRSGYELQPRPRLEGHAAGSGLTTAIVVVLVIAALYFGRDIFIPIALAALLSFALAPLVRRLRRIGVPRLPSVLAVVVVAFVVLLAFAGMVALQIGDLAQRLPSYQHNLEAKIGALREAPPGGRLFDRASEMLTDLGRQIDDPAEEEETATADPDAPAEQEPIPVEVHQPAPTSLQILRTFIGPLIGPLATFGIVIVFVIFMLLKREDLRNRVIRLVGSRDLSRTTSAIDDAAQRVGQYLLMQLVVNVTYGVPIGIGLWLIGVPNPVLWGMLATVLRFVPYIGPVIAAAFPLALAVAVDPGWTTFLWAAALIVVLELISNNFVEPWLYGTSTGLSPVAIIAAAIFWTWLWGPVGLLLSTPLTVCLVVLGRHVPQLGFFDVLFGSEPALTPAENLYQRLLASDPDEATEMAEKYLRDHPLHEYYEDVAIPALALTEEDRRRGVLDDAHRANVAESALVLVENLVDAEAIPAEPEDEPEGAVHDGDAVSDDTGVATTPPRIPPQTAIAGEPVIVSAGARGNIDEAAATILGQLLGQRGASVTVLPCDDLQSARLQQLDLANVGLVVLSYMNADSFAHARFLVRRLRRRLPQAKIMIGFWTHEAEDPARRDPLESTGADMIFTGLCDAVVEIARMYPAPEREADHVAVEATETASPALAGSPATAGS